MPTAAPQRMLLGFVAGALSVLTFHAAIWEVLHVLALPGFGMPAPYPMAPTQPLGLPVIASLCFWGGLYGAAFGLVAPRLAAPLWLSGLMLGVIAVLVAATVVATLKGQPMWMGGSINGWARSLIINGVWGIEVGVILRLLVPRRSRVLA